MPIRAEERARYPADWPLISQRVRERAGQKCEWCGVANGALGGRLSDGTFVTAPDGVGPGASFWHFHSVAEVQLRVIKIVLTVAHLNHAPEDCADSNLKALCQRCHLRYDAKMHADGIKSRRRAKMALGDLLGEGR